MKFVSRMSGGSLAIRLRSSSFSWPVYRAMETGAGPLTFLRNLLISSSWLFANAFIGYTITARVRFGSPRSRSARMALTTGMKKQSDLPEPVPVVTT